MNNNTFVNQSPFIRTTREFPKDPMELTDEINQAYLDIATTINVRTIGIYPVNRPAITGNNYFVQSNQKQQTLRQVYTFDGAAPAPIQHGINVLGISRFTPSCYGSYLDDTGNYNGIIYASSVAIAGQVSFYITPNTSGDILDGTIVVVVDPGAPPITQGIIVLEWIANTYNPSV